VPNKTPIGKILIEKKKINPVQLGQALKRQLSSGGRLASNLLDLGIAKEEDLLGALGEQLGIPTVDLTRSVIPLAAIKFIPENVALDAKILPLKIEEDRIFLAVSDPENKKTLDEVSFVTGRKVEAYVALEARLVKVIHDAYDLIRRDPNAVFYRGEHAAEPAAGEDTNGRLSVIAQPLPKPDIEVVPDEELVTIEVSTSAKVLAEVSKPEPLPVTPLVLVVDDEPDIVKLLEKALTTEGYRAISASRGLEALQLVKNNQPNLVLLDAMLPEIHGFEICKKIKSSKRFGAIPVIMISAVYRGWRYAQDVKEIYGADDYFEKPFRLVPLLRRVRELLNTGPSQPDTQVNLNAANQNYQKAMEFYREKNFNEAEKALSEACRLDPFNHNIHYALANVLLAKNQVFEAIREYEHTIELKPDFFAPLRNLAILYQKKGFKNKAVEMWERSLRYSPEGPLRQQIKEQLLKLL
jgi:DNA-binding response OmpR family regulator